MFQARHREKVTGEKFWKSSRRREERCLSPSPVPNCSKAVRFFPLSLSLFSKIKQQFKNFFQVRFSTGLTGEGGREKVAIGAARERSYYLEKSASARFSINLMALPSSREPG